MPITEPIRQREREKFSKSKFMTIGDKKEIDRRRWSFRDVRVKASEFTRLTLIEEVIAMDWNRVEGNWKEAKGKVKEKWGKLTDDDLTAINGQREQLEGRLQQRYGYAKDQSKKEVDEWFASWK